MRSKGCPAELEHRRVLAIRRLLEGFTSEEIAEFFEVRPSSVRRWFLAFRQHGWPGVFAKPAHGRPAKLTRTQEKIVLRWLTECPTDHGFATELWSTTRLAQLIREEWGVAFNARYLPRWLRARDFSLQKPERVPRERKPEVIAAWVESNWQRLKKKRWRNECT